MCFVQLTDWAYAVTTSVLANFIELCLFDIAQTDTQTVTEAIQSFNGSVQITSMVSIDINILITYLISIVCPGEPTCNGRGQCVNGFCVCDSGRWLTIDTFTACSKCVFIHHCHICYWLFLHFKCHPWLLHCRFSGLWLFSQCIIAAFNHWITYKSSVWCPRTKSLHFYITLSLKLCIYRDFHQ